MKRIWIVFLVLTMVGSASAWWPRGHGILTRAAIDALPNDYPAFMKAGKGMVAHASVDPDVAKNRATISLEKAVHPIHFFNAELVEGKTLPISRYDFARLCEEVGKKPEQVGLLPYALAEATDQLTLALAEYRKWPEHPYIQNKCLLYAGTVAHFAQELCQPLNLTIFWNGRGPDGKPKNTRIHEKIDSLVQTLELTPEGIAKEIKPEAVDSLMGAIVAQVENSRKQIDHALALETVMMPKDADLKNDASVLEFTKQQAQEAARFTAVLFLTAWEKSASVRLPGWIDRGDMDHFGRK